MWPVGRCESEQKGVSIGVGELGSCIYRRGESEGIMTGCVTQRDIEGREAVSPENANFCLPPSYLT